MKQCPKCSERNTDDSKFCKSCGENLENVDVISEDLSVMAGDLVKRANGLFSEGTKKAKEAMTAGVEKAKEAVEAGKEKMQSASPPKDTPTSYTPAKQIQPEAPLQPQTSSTHAAPNEEIKCPKCGAVGCMPQYKQNVSGGGYGCCSGGLGALVLGPLGLLCGACGRSVKTKNTLVWICPKCGHEFQCRSKKDAKNIYVVKCCFVALFMCVFALALSTQEARYVHVRLFLALYIAGCYALMAYGGIYKARVAYTDEEKKQLKRITAITGGIAAICLLIF